MTRKKTNAQLDREIAAALAKPRGRHSLEPSPAEVKDAVYAVAERRGSEDLTPAEWREEVRGLLRYGSAKTEKLIDLYCQRIHGGA